MFFRKRISDSITTSSYTSKYNNRGLHTQHQGLQAKHPVIYNRFLNQIEIPHKSSIITEARKSQTSYVLFTGLGDRWQLRQLLGTRSFRNNNTNSMLVEVKKERFVMKQILNSLCSNLPIEWISTNMFVPSEAGPRNKHRNLWFGWCVYSWWPWFWSVCSIYYYIITIN